MRQISRNLHDCKLMFQEMWELYDVTLQVIVSFKFYVMNFVDFVIDFCSHITSHVSQAFASCTHNTSYSLLNFVHVIVCVYGLTNHVLKNTLSFMQNCFVALKNGGDCLKYKFLENWFKTCVLGEHFISYSCIFFLIFNALR